MHDAHVNEWKVWLAKPLSKLIEPYLNGPRSDVPAELRQRFRDVLFLWSFWDKWEVDQRLSMAQQHDVQHDPSMAAENEHWFQLACKVDACKREIKKWELMHPQSITEAALKDDKLTALNAELAALNLQYSVPFEGSAPAQTKEMPVSVAIKRAEAVTLASNAHVTTAPAWSLITTLQRAPGYRWPLYQALKEALTAGRPCPKAREVLEAWKQNTPPELEVMTDGVKYSDSKGNTKEADLKAIQQAIKGLIKK